MKNVRRNGEGVFLGNKLLKVNIMLKTSSDTQNLFLSLYSVTTPGKIQGAQIKPI